MKPARQTRSAPGRLELPGEPLLVRRARLARASFLEAAPEGPGRGPSRAPPRPPRSDEDEDDPRRQLAPLAGVGEGLEVRAAAREEDREARREREPGDGRDVRGRRSTAAHAKRTPRGPLSTRPTARTLSPASARRRVTSGHAGRGDEEDHPDAAVEDPEHLVLARRSPSPE